MACRHLNIKFLENGDVEYSFFRHHSKFMLNRYLINWPASQIEIHGGQCFYMHGLQKKVTIEGCLLLEWDKVIEEGVGLGREVIYTKKNYLKKISSEPVLWRYYEEFKVKPNLYLWLHSPWEKLNAIKSKSTAEFISANGQKKFYRPRNLAECVFRENGLLIIDWTLEVLEKPRRIW